MNGGRLSFVGILVIIFGGLLVVIFTAELGALYARRKGFSNLGKDTVVRCSKGDLFTTIWIPGNSFKSVRLGFKRYQRCPVCGHWRIVTPVKDSELTDEIKRIASKHLDKRIP